MQIKVIISSISSSSFYWNGQCNPENLNAQCLFDQGDCCDKTLIGNNECDAVNNFTQCGFDGGDCTIVEFEKKNFIGSESCGFANISIVRLFGSEKETSVKWKTIGYSTNQSGIEVAFLRSNNSFFGTWWWRILHEENRRGNRGN